MTAAVEKTKTEEEDATMSTTTETKKTDPPPPSHPPLVTAIYRLEGLLKQSSSSSTTSTTTSEDADYWKHPPSKVVKRWLGTTSGTAQKATLATIVEATKLVLDPTSSKGRELLLSSLKDDDDDAMMETTTTTTTTTTDETQPTYLSSEASREVEAWLLSCAIRLLWKQQDKSPSDVAFRLAQQSVALVEGYLSVPTSSAGGLFPLLARLYRYQSLVASSSTELTVSLRPTLVLAHGTATQRRDVDTQATLLNLLLHDLLNASQVEQAHKLWSNSTFPADNKGVPNNQLCRYLYSSGRIQALRLEYSEAFSSLSTCFRKAPTNTGLGFRLSCQRLLIVVQLLLGEIPNRQQAFSSLKEMTKELEPYLALTQAVRRGDLSVFASVVATHAERFQSDNTYTLISRLEHVVVKAGLRQLQMAYSRIGLDDVSQRLGLSTTGSASSSSAASAEFVVSKAIRDGVVEATIHHEEGYVESHDLTNIYSTSDPQKAFHRRIAYCLTTHNDAVRGMRYPPDAYKKQLEASRGEDSVAAQKKKKKGKKGDDDDDDKTDEERARELEEEMEEDDY